MSAWHVRSTWVDAGNPYYVPEGAIEVRPHRPDWARASWSRVSAATRDLNDLHGPVRRALHRAGIRDAEDIIARVRSRLTARLVAGMDEANAAAAALRSRGHSIAAANTALEALSGVSGEDAREPGLLEAVRDIAAARRAHVLAARNAALRVAEERIRAIAAARALEAGAVGLPPISRSRRDA